MTLALWQGMQAVAQDLTSAAMESQTYFVLSSFTVVFREGWESQWIMLKTTFLKGGGTQGLRVPVLVSQMMDGPLGISILSKIILEC